MLFISVQKYFPCEIDVKISFISDIIVISNSNTYIAIYSYIYIYIHHGLSKKGL